MDNITLGIVIPVFGSTRSVAELVHQIHTVFTPVCTYHIYLVDDGNPENVSSWLRKNCRLIIRQAALTAECKLATTFWP